METTVVSRVEELERQLKETSERLVATREQMRLQGRRARQLVAACTSKVEEKEREMQTLRALKDGQLQSIVRQLLHFESLLRQEQNRIVDIVRQKDQVIGKQKSELEQLRAANRKLLMAAHQNQEEESPDSKMAKLERCREDKENVLVATTSLATATVPETPLVTKMVRRFELPPSVAPTAFNRKPEVPKKPTRLLSPTTVIAADNIATATAAQQQPLAVGGSRGVVRTDSVNDYGYFTLEKRKPASRMSVTTAHAANDFEQEQPQSPTTPATSPLGPSPNGDLTVGDETDLRQNFEEFHLMDSLEEEEQLQLFQETTVRTPDRSSGDGAERTSIMMTPPRPGDCTSLSVSAGSGLQILPQLGDATPTSGVQFDRFLDVSGLTQKSILTPSRLLSNHKNMLKPKDVKHRHMINKAGGNGHHHVMPVNLMGQCRASNNNNDPIGHHNTTNHVRYYVEPFL